MDPVASDSADTHRSREGSRGTVFTPGRVLTQYCWFGQAVLVVNPVRVVRDTHDGLLLWLPRGAPVWRADLPADRHVRDIPRSTWPVGGFPLRPDGRHPVDQLVYQPVGAAYSVWFLFAPGGGFVRWYVNLEHRVWHGDDVHVTDLELDILVAPDRSWAWKDEESFAGKTGDPAFWTREQAHAIRAEGHRVIRMVEAGRFPFDGTWCDYRPDPAWPLPPRPVLSSGR